MTMFEKGEVAKVDGCARQWDRQWAPAVKGPIRETSLIDARIIAAMSPFYQERSMPDLINSRQSTCWWSASTNKERAWLPHETVSAPSAVVEKFCSAAAAVGVVPFIFAPLRIMRVPSE